MFLVDLEFTLMLHGIRIDFFFYGKLSPRLHLIVPFSQSLIYPPETLLT